MYNIAGGERCCCSTFTLLLLLSLMMMVWTRKAGAETNESQPLACSEGIKVCSAYLYYKPKRNESREYVANLLGLHPRNVARDRRRSGGQKEEGLFLQVSCECQEGRGYMYAAAATNASREVYDGLAWNADNPANNTWLLCGCLQGNDTLGGFGALLSYVLAPSSEDNMYNHTLSSLAARFLSSVPAIVALNNITNQSLGLFPHRIYFLPINIAHGKLTQLPPSPPPTPHGVPPVIAPTDLSLSTPGNDGDDGMPLGVVIGIVAATCVLILAAVGVAIVARKLVLSKRPTDDLGNHSEAKTRNAGKWCLGGGGSRDLSLLGALCLHETEARSSKAPPATLSREMTNFNMGPEKPLIYAYEEVLAATENFKESNVLGQGAFGTVYYGMLRDQEVAIKRMKAAITKEFLAEMKVLCKFHHTNLNELYGYASFADDLFLVYEYAEHRALSDRLHEPISKGFPPLTWNARVQIALDTAKGLEYIHEHTKEHYVHRDVKSSNILLDADFRAKVADFGIARLVEKTGGGDVSVTRIVGTFGYLAPEYSRDGIATSKSDVYAFGVVLFELITGKQAISKSRSSIPSTPERRSLVSIMLRAIKDCPNALQINGLREVLDPVLNDRFPPDCVYKMAKLGQQCVEEDPILRPDMKFVVFTLSQISFSSMEWEASCCTG